MNGESIGTQLDRLERMVTSLRLEIKADLNDLHIKVDKINLHGCAHRMNDLVRIEKLESWRDKGIIGVVLLLAGALAQFFGLHLGGAGHP